MESYTEDALLSKYIWSTDNELEYFLAVSGGNADMASFRGKFACNYLLRVHNADERSIRMPGYYEDDLDKPAW